MNNRKELYKRKQEIIIWLNMYQIKDYIIVPNDEYGFVVDVKNDVDLNRSNLFSIPVKFNKVGGDFSCSNNQLSDLKFAPNSVGGSFYCQKNNLVDLEFCPKNIGSSLMFNEGVKLLFIPKFVGRKTFMISDIATTEVSFEWLVVESLKQNKEKLDKEIEEVIGLNKLNGKKIKI